MTLKPDVQVPPLRFFYDLQWAPWIVWWDFDQATRGIPGVYVTSWFRTKARNAGADGVSHSQHLIGTAIDVDVPADRRQLEVIRARLRYCQYTLNEGDHLHGQLWLASTENLYATIDRLSIAA